jgi:biopolymer transport protein ExbD
VRRTIKRRQHEVPELNMAALPDLIFTVLFFFMIVTHMRDVEHRVSYEVPAGHDMEQVGHRKNVVYIYIGRPLDSKADEFVVQLGNRIATVDEIPAFVKEARSSMSEEDRERMTVCIRADRHTPMSLIHAVKQQLRDVYALNVTYSALEGTNAK